VLVIFGMGILLPTMVQAFQANLLAASGQVDVTISHRTNEAFSRTVLNRVKNIQGIRALTGSLSRTVNDMAMSFYVILLLVLTLPSLVAILNTLAIGVIERTREIGMLRAIGSTRGQVRLMVLAEALLLAAIGTAFGLLAGLYLGYVLVLGLSAGGFPVTYTFALTGIVAAIAAGLVFGVLAALIPARQAAQLEIILALRYE